MTNDRPPTDPRLDDDSLGDLVRDAVDGWRMPPERLHATTWRERIGPRPRRSSWGRGPRGGARWLGRLGVATSAAIVSAVLLALVAVWLGSNRPASVGVAATHPPSQVAGAGQTPVPTANPVSFPPGSSGPTAGPLPRFALSGPPLTGRVIAGAGQGFVAIDLGTGSAGADLVPGATSGSQLFHRPGGGLICACQAFASTDFVSGTMMIEIRVIAAAGGTVQRIPVETLTGNADPYAGGYDSAGVTATAALSPDARTVYVAWAYRTSPLWHLGIDVVDLGSGTVVQRMRLADRPSIVSGSPVGLWMGALRVAPDGSSAMLSIAGLDGAAGVEHVLATISRGRIAETGTLPVPSVTISGSVCTGSGTEGWATAQSYYVVCGGPASGVIVFDRAGRIVASQVFAGSGQPSGPWFAGSDVVNRAAGLLYHWDPFGRTLTRVDLATGRITGTATAAQADTGGGPLGVLGDLGRTIAGWIAPPATAKVFLQPGLALAPDGSRIYALGIAPSGSGSSGVDVFDTRTMTQLDHWAPLADLISIAVSADGRYVYVAGAPGGNSSQTYPA
ncbi:MAG: YncE family protein, partial [Candidatus Limnocylindrales bacterium]